MRLWTTGAATAFARPKAFFGALFLLSVAFGVPGLRPEPAVAQSENPDVTATEELRTCEGLADKEIAAGTMDPRFKQLTIGLCSTVFYDCKIKIAGALGDPNTPQALARVRRCAKDQLDQDEKEGNRILSKRSDNSGDNTRCEIEAATHPDQALSYCTDIINSDDSSVHEKALAYADRAIAEVTSDNYDKNGQAAADVNASFGLDTNAGEAYFARGLILVNKLQAEKAVIDFDRALTYSLPDYLRCTVYGALASAHYFLGVDKSDKIMYAQALKEINEAIRIRPFPAFYRQRGEIEHSIGQISASKADLATARRAEVSER